MGFNYDPEISMEEAKTLLDIRQTVVQQLAEKGFSIPTKPVVVDGHGAQQAYEGGIPYDLTALSDQELGYYMSILTVWMNYCGIQKTLADMSRTVAKRQLETFEAKLRLKNKLDEEGKRRSNPERDDIVNSNRQIVEAQSAYMHLDFYYAFIAQVYKNAEQNYAAISRRITQRGQETDRTNRTQNVHNKPVGPSLFQQGSNRRL